MRSRSRTVLQGYGSRRASHAGGWCGASRRALAGPRRSGQQPATKNKPPNAKLKVHKRSETPHLVDVDASGSSDKDGMIESYTYWVTEAESGQVVRGPFRTDHSQKVFALGPGKYDVFVEVEDDRGASNTASKSVRIKEGEVRLSANGTPCSSSGNGKTVTCTLMPRTITTDQTAMASLAPASLAVASLADLPQTTVTEDLEELMATAGATSTTPMGLIAWGGKGGDGKNGIGHSGGSPGEVGEAVTLTTVRDFQSVFGTSTIHYYLGNNGHHDNAGGDGSASTVVMTVEPTGQRA